MYVYLSILPDYGKGHYTITNVAESLALWPDPHDLRCEHSTRLSVLHLYNYQSIHQQVCCMNFCVSSNSVCIHMYTYVHVCFSTQSTKLDQF